MASVGRLDSEWRERELLAFAASLAAQSDGWFESATEDPERAIECRLAGEVLKDAHRRLVGILEH